MQVTILHNQSLLDIAVQHTGNIENAFAISAANGLAVSDALTPGTVLMIPENVVYDKDILNYYQSKNIKPATAITILPSAEPELEGIGYWTIEKTFKVS